MIIGLCIGYFVNLVLSIYLLKVVHRHERDIFNREFKIEALQRKTDGYNESVEVLSTSVRKLNGVVKDLEQKQPKIEPKSRMNTRAFISGWDADEPEPLSKEEWKQMVNAILNCQRIVPLPQQCILPLQQTFSGSILPLWYINGRLEDME